MALSSQFWVLLLVKMSFLLWGSSYHLECSLSKYVFYVSPHRNSTQPPLSNTTFISKSFLFILAVSSFSIFWMIKYFISSFWRVFHIDSIKKKLGEKNDRTMQTCFMMNSWWIHLPSMLLFLFILPQISLLVHNPVPSPHTNILLHTNILRPS